MRQNKGHHIKVFSTRKLVTEVLTLHQGHEEVSGEHSRAVILNVAVKCQGNNIKFKLGAV